MIDELLTDPDHWSVLVSLHAIIEVFAYFGVLDLGTFVGKIILHI